MTEATLLRASVLINIIIRYLLLYLIRTLSVFEKSKPRSVFGPLNVYGVLALAGIVAPFMLGLADIIAALSSPEYDWARDSISSLALTPMGWIQTIGFLFSGLLVEVFVVGLFLSIRRRWGFGFSIGVFVCFGFGLLLIGAFQTDPSGAPDTIEGTIHSITAIVAFSIFPGACLLISPSLKSDPHWKGFFPYTIVTSVLALILLIIHLWLPKELGWFGLCERILVANMVIWVEVMAIQLLRLSLRLR